MVTNKKANVVDQTADRLNRSQAVLLVDYKGLSVAEMTDLRARLRENDSELKVVKNRLTKLALKQAECDDLDDLLNGPMALAFGYSDASAPAKVCAEFAKDNEKLEIKGGLLEKQRIGLDRVIALSKLPGRPELLTQMAGTMMAPARQLATAMHQAMAKIVYAMKDRAGQLESEA